MARNCEHLEKEGILRLMLRISFKAVFLKQQLAKGRLVESVSVILVKQLFNSIIDYLESKNCHSFGGRKLI